MQLVTNAALEGKLTAADAEAPVEGTWLLFWGDQAARKAETKTTLTKQLMLFRSILRTAG